MKLKNIYNLLIKRLGYIRRTGMICPKWKIDHLVLLVYHYDWLPCMDCNFAICSL